MSMSKCPECKHYKFQTGEIRNGMLFMPLVCERGLTDAPNCIGFVSKHISLDKEENS